MSTLYTHISQIGHGELFVLNRNYTKEQLREKLSVPGGPDEEIINRALTKGITLSEPLTIDFKDEGTITTQQSGSTWYLYKRDKAIIKPDGGFQIIEYLNPFERIYYPIEDKIYESIVKPLRKRYREWKRKRDRPIG